MSLDPNVPLEQRAQRLWPDDPRNQAEWIRAVGVVRSTKTGWKLDAPVPFLGKRRRVRGQ